MYVLPTMCIQATKYVHRPWMQTVIVRIFVPVASWLLVIDFSFPSSFFPGLRQTGSWCRRLKPPNSYGLWSQRCIHGYVLYVLMYNVYFLYYLLYSWIMWHIHILCIFIIMYYYITYRHICIPWRNIQFHFALGLRVLILVQFDSVDYYFRPTQNQVFHVKQKTSGRSYAMKVLHKVGILAKLFPGKVTDFRWRVYSNRFWFYWHEEFFRIFQYEHMKSNTQCCPLFLELREVWMKFWSFLFQQSYTFVIKLMAKSWDMQPENIMFVWKSWECWRLDSLKQICMYIYIYTHHGNW